MPPTITGDIITDALVNLKTALETQNSTWGVSQVYKFPSMAVGIRGNAIALEVVGWQPQLIGSAGPTVQLAHKVTMRVWYITSSLRTDVAFSDIYTKLSKMIAWLIENPNPNGYGELLIDDQAFGPTVEEIAGIETEAGALLAGKFTLVHTYFKTHTQTLS